MNDMLAPDCSRCAALCCVALAFDRSEHFAFDKPAGRACVHLTVAHACAIHDELESRGFGGCARYDCAGAGQRVTMEMFGGRSWRDDPNLLRPMIDAFHRVRDAHELLLLLRAAKKLPLADEDALNRERCETALVRFEDGSIADARAFFRALSRRGAACARA